MRKLIAGNWKMNGSQTLAATLVPHIASFAASTRAACDIAIFPPTLFIAKALEAAQGSTIAIGAQDVSAHKGGAYTGEMSAAMLKELGCRYVIVGHSERRQYHGENDAQVAAKAKAALDTGLTPIICVGETQAERDSGNAMAIVASQLGASVPAGANVRDFVLAYEPVWAIGSGKVPASADIAQMHRHIMSLLPGAKILYGGSVKAANAREILSTAHVAGVLVGGASLVEHEFCGIIAAAEE